MSIENREKAANIFEWGFKIGITAIGTLLIIMFSGMKDDIKEVGADIKDVSTEVRKDIKNVNDRLIRVETKIENR